MNRRPPPNAAQERAAQNQQTIKTLLKIESNKSCADCKRNKHPRWASWNLGVFVCIRCSGIHRGMGTHISRVKSVDLDAWTDEQLQSILKWGNSRANKYWESKLSPGHVPSEAKIENFIRTKYESRRWVMEGPMPDPATLDTEGDDEVPLNVVQEKAKLDRVSSQRNASTSSQPIAAPPKPAPPVDLFGDVPEPPARPSTTDTPGSRAPPPKGPAATKPTKTSDSLLGLDFFGGPSAPTTGRPASSASTPNASNVPSRPDLKQSILSLYASAPKPQPSNQHDRQSSFGGMQSAPAQKPSSFGGLDDAFGGLAVTSPISKPSQPVKSDPFAGFNSTATQRSSAAPPQVTSPLSGGGFFDTGPKPASKPAPKPAVQPKPHANLTPLESSDFGDFSFASSPPSTAAKQSAPKASNDLFDVPATLPPAPRPAKPAETSNISSLTSPFNLSKPQPPTESAPKASATTQNTVAGSFSGFSSSDAWGSNDAWSTPDPAPAAPARPKAPSIAKAPSISMTNDFSAWGGTESTTNQFSANTSTIDKPQRNPPKVTPDEDFGGWTTVAPPATSKPNPAPVQSKPTSGGFGGDDLFSNVWE